VKTAVRTRQKFFWLAPLALALCAFGVGGAVVPARFDSGRIPNVAIWDEAGQKRLLWAELQGAGDGPIIVLPVYTRCAMSCPPLTRKLAQETARLGGRAAYRVLIFSFDPAEDTESIRKFREREHVPANWLFVRAEDAEIRSFFDYFHYSIMTEGSVLVHPNEVFLLDRDLNWRATLVDVNWSSAELGEWIGRVESPGIRGWLAMNPEKLAWTGFSGMLLGAGVCVGWLIRRKP